MALTGLELERIPPGEAQCTNDLGARLKAKIIRDNAGGMMRRDAHPKMHGLVQATFTVEPGLPGDLAVGLFSAPKRYQAWVRLSNQDGAIRPDIKGDIRGLAIKLMGVPGAKLLSGEKDAQTHDFVTISTDVFVAKDVAEFDGVLPASVRDPLTAV